MRVQRVLWVLAALLVSTPFAKADSTTRMQLADGMPLPPPHKEVLSADGMPLPPPHGSQTATSI